MKRYVFNFDLKICNVGAVLIWIGNVFQSLGAAMAKARSPLDFNFDFGTVNKLWLADLRVFPDDIHTTSQRGKGERGHLNI